MLTQRDMCSRLAPMKSDSPQSLEFPDETKGHFQNQGSYDDGRNQFYGLAIGAMAVAASYAAGPISGGLMNPAITIGADLAGAGAGFGSSLIYAAFQLPP